MIIIKDINDFRKINSDRNKYIAKNQATSVQKWNRLDWLNALLGEIGELANLMKKINRGDDISQESIMEEVGDVFTYFLLYCDYENINPIIEIEANPLVNTLSEHSLYLAHCFYFMINDTKDIEIKRGAIDAFIEGLFLLVDKINKIDKYNFTLLEAVVYTFNRVSRKRNLDNFIIELESND